MGGPTSSNQRPTFADRSLMSRTISSRPDEPPTAARPSDRVLFTQMSPALSVETVGPRQIAIGKEATFEVSIHNRGEVAAEETLVIVALPPSADFMRADTSVGSARSEAVDGEHKQIRWAVGRIAPGGAEKLTLVIIPRENRPFDLVVRWDHRPVSSQAMIEVQEAKLTMRLDGPAEVLYGEEEVYRLELSNTGNGPAREILISLTPLGAGENASVNHTIHELAAGETKVIQVELTARQTGVLTIAVDATGDGVHAHLEERIIVRRAALAVEVDAPPMQFVGTQATHHIRVRNTGTAVASQVQISALIPPGTSYVSSSARGVVNDDQSRVVWLLTELAPGAEKHFQIVCVMGRAGTSRLEVVCKAGRDLTASDVAVVQVEAMADLAMEVRDPSGPVAIGADAVYTIRIENRGTKGAENIDLKAFFSPGIEPVNVEGGTHRMATGLVTFERIPSLAAGQSMFFEITARAQTPGNHVFRAELTCKPIGADLVSQETTHFYGNSTTTTPGVSVASETEEPSRLVEEEVRTARRPTPAGPSPYFVPSGAFSRPSPISGSNGAAAATTTDSSGS